MSLFSRKAPSLHEQHAAAHAVGQNAIGLFHSLAADLEEAAERHSQVADAAAEQASELLALTASADAAAVDAQRQANAIRSLVA